MPGEAGELAHGEAAAVLILQGTIPPGERRYDSSRFGNGRIRRRARSVNTARKPIRPVIAKTRSSGHVRMRRRLPTPRFTQSVHADATRPGTNQTVANVAAGNPKYQRRQPSPRSKTV